jgi:hypothetical protein
MDKEGQLISLIREIDELLATERISGERDGNQLLIRFDRSDRTQKIRIEQQNSTYLFTSTVAKVKDVIGRATRARDDLVFRILCRNALKPIVFLHIDDRDRVVGQVTCPVASADTAEIEFYLNTLARDCDRFEYILLGLDQN